MATIESIVAVSAESVFEIGDRLTGLLEQARHDAASDGIAENALARLAETVEALRSRLVRKVERDPRSLFDLDERLIGLMDCAEEAAECGGEVPQELLLEINDYLEAYRTKIDRIAGT